MQLKVDQILEHLNLFVLYLKQKHKLRLTIYLIAHSFDVLIEHQEVYEHF